MSEKIRVGVLGATGMVGQRCLVLLQRHPWFEVCCVAASPRSAGKTYGDAVAATWAQREPVPEAVRSLQVYSVQEDRDAIAANVGLVFCSLQSDKETIRAIEEEYASVGVAVVSCNSAHRWTEDVPMVIPEVNPDHLEMIHVQRNRRGWSSGLIVTKPNCSVQSYVPVLHAWQDFHPQQVVVSTYQAISGAGKTFDSWPEMVDNVIPYIAGEEEKSEKEPMKIWATLQSGAFDLASTPQISAHCVRVPVTDGHMATLNVRFAEQVTKERLVKALHDFRNPLDDLHLPSAPKPLLMYLEEEDRPQTRLDRNVSGGMGISVGRLRTDPVMGWKCVALSHNTVRGAAGGAILTAELLVKRGFISRS